MRSQLGTQSGADPVADSDALPATAMALSVPFDFLARKSAAACYDGIVSAVAVEAAARRVIEADEGPDRPRGHSGAVNRALTALPGTP